MRIGDQVRLLHGTEEGRIVEIKGNIVEIEIDDGFIIPSLKNEVVVVAHQEVDNFRNEKSEEPQKSSASRADLLSDGIYLGLIENKSSLFDAFLINQTPQSLLFSIGQMDKKSFQGKSHGICEQYEAKSIGTFSSSILNENKKISTQIIMHENNAPGRKQPLNIDFSFTKTQLGNKKYISTLSKEVSLIKLELNKFMDFNPFELKEKMMGGAIPVRKNASPIVEKAEDIIDLHVDDLESGLKSNEILDHQLHEFEKAYDNALRYNTKKLKIIHGIGAGILRSEIHKRLSTKKEVVYFEDGDKERFGFGSTVIHF